MRISYTKISIYLYTLILNIIFCTKWRPFIVLYYIHKLKLKSLCRQSMPASRLFCCVSVTTVFAGCCKMCPIAQWVCVTAVWWRRRWWSHGVRVFIWDAFSKCLRSWVARQWHGSITTRRRAAIKLCTGHAHSQSFLNMLFNDALSYEGFVVSNGRWMNEYGW